jgi:hypothetical protein
MTMNEQEAREIAKKYADDHPALKSLADGGRPGARWLVDGMSYVRTVKPFSRDEMKQLASWIVKLPDTWWASSHDMSIDDWIRDHAYSVDDIVLGNAALTDSQLPALYQLLDLVRPGWRKLFDPIT